MSDIPVGSPPVPPGRHAAPGGWYPDPAQPGQERYWDGWQWSRNTRPVEVTHAPGVHPYPGYAQPGPGPVSGHQPGPPPPYGQSGPPVSGYGQPYAYPPGPTPGVSAVSARGQANLTADGVPLAPWGWRLLAVVIDGVAFGLIAQVVVTPVVLLTGNRFGEWYSELIQAYVAGIQGNRVPDLNALLATLPIRDLLLQTALSTVLLTAYHLVFLRLKAATPGKLICGLRVVPAGRGQAPARLSWHQAGVRVLVWAVAGSLISLLRLLDGLWPLWQPKRQALHDLAAGTQVIKASKQPAPPNQPAYWR